MIAIELKAISFTSSSANIKKSDEMKIDTSQEDDNFITLV
jgi:hypothetical protein